MDFVSFFAGIGTDDKGHLISDIKHWSDEQLEDSHNFIQRVFPLKEKSRAQPDSPTITDEQIEKN